MPTLAINPRAKYDYEILETYEAGIVLAGYEVKSIKTGHISLKGSYAVIRNNEAFLLNAQYRLISQKIRRLIMSQAEQENCSSIKMK